MGDAHGRRRGGRLEGPRKGRADRLLLATLVIDALAFGIVVPVVPGLVMRLGGLDQSAASVWMGGLLAVFSAMQFLCAPLLGAMSDRWGRRTVLLLSLAGTCANNLALAVAPTLPWLFLGRAVAGATAAYLVGSVGMAGGSGMNVAA